MELFFCFGQLCQRKLERRVLQCLTESVQRVLGRFAELAGSGFGLAWAKGNLHLYADSVNLAPAVSQHNNNIRNKLAQLGGDGGIGNGDAENTRLQPQYLAGLCKIGGGSVGKMALQGRQGLCFDQ